MSYRLITFPTTGGGSSSGGGLIKPVFSRTAPNIGLPNPYAVVDVGTVLAQAAQLNRTATSAADKQLTVAALDSTVPVPYGRVKVPALLANAIVTDSNLWLFWCLWAAGPIEAVEQLYINDAPPGFGMSESKLGELDQTTIGGLFYYMTIWGHVVRGFPPSVTFNEAAPGIANSAIFAPIGDITTPPKLNAILRGRKIYDPRDIAQNQSDATSWLYSNNAALVLADFLASARYGAGYGMDWTSVSAAADACDAAGRTVDILVDKKATTSDWVATLSQAANCFIELNGNTVKITPDADTSSVAAFGHADGEILAVQNEEGQGRNNLPTVIEIIYTDASQTTWQDASVLVKRPGVDDGTAPWRKASIRMPWIQSEARAIAEAYLYGNKLWLRWPKMNLLVMDEGAQPEVGDRVALTYPDSGYAANLRTKIANAKPTVDGWLLGVFYDDPGAYIDDRWADPTPPTNQPDPLVVPPVSALAGIEDATTTSIIATWTPPDYPFIKDFLVDITQASTPIESGRSMRGYNQYHSGVVTAGLDYVVTVRVRNTLGILSVPVSVTVFVNALTYVPFRYTFTTPTLVNMERMIDWGTGDYFWVTSMGDLWNPTFPSNMNTYTNPLLEYHTPGTSTITTEVADAGVIYTGDWAGAMPRIDLNGVGAGYIELASASPTPRTRHAGGTFTGAGRYAALSSEATGTGTQRVNGLGDIAVTISR